MKVISSAFDKGKDLAFRWVTKTLASSELEDTILVTGAPRSGTTWIAEMLSRLPAYKLLNEPLLIHNNPSVVAHGVDWRTFVAPGEDRPQLERYLRRLFMGRIGLGPWWHFRREGRLGKLREHIRCRNLVVKLCRAGRMLNWITARFPIRGTIFIVRHPCAVVSSMLEWGGWPVLKPDQYPGRARTPEALLLNLPNELLNDHGNFLRGLETQHEIFAATWCLDHYIPLIYNRDERSDWKVIRYEEIFLTPKTVIKDISGYLDIKINMEVASPRKGSKYSSSSLYVDGKDSQVTKWKEKLSKEQIEDIQMIVRRFSLQEYL